MGVAVAGMLVVAAVRADVFRGPEGYVSGAIVVPLAVAVAAILLTFVDRALRPAAGWFSLALVGQAAALQLVRAGFMIGYQHFAVSNLLSPARLPAVLFLLLQACIVAWGMRGRWGAVGRFIRTRIGVLRALVLASFFIIASSTLSQDPRVYVAELLFASIVQTMALFTVVLAAVTWPESRDALLSRFFERLLGAEDAGEGARLDRWAIVTACAVTGICALLAFFSYQRHPHVPDEVVYLYHARYFARAMLTMPLPPVPDAFNLDLMTIEATRWYSPVPPGWPAVLAIGAFFGAAWLVNPVLNGINVLLAYGLLLELYGRRTARLGTLLLACSPWFLFMGMNFMTHSLTMTAALAAVLGVAKLRRAEAVPWLWVTIAGIGIGVLGLIRPLEGLTVAVLLGLWGLGRPGRALQRLVPVVIIAIVSIAVTSITFPYNRELAGSATTFPLMAYTDSIYGVGTNALGFGANRGLGWPGLDPFPGHGLIDVLVNGNLNVFQVNTELLGWAVGSSLPILLLLAAGPLRTADRWMIVGALAIIAIHSVYWFSGGPDFGARYWYLILVPCIALAARGVLALGAKFPSDGHAARVQAAAIALCLATLFVFVPWRAIDKYFHYRNMRPDVRTLAETHDFGKSIVFVRGNRHPDYASAAIYNPLDLSADEPIYVWDRGPDLARQVLAAFPGRAIHIVDGPTRTGGRFRVAGTNVPAEELLATSAAEVRRQP
jgi:4-amino-4-deoxy-L-arabinose transferase-like glycosyltransferase